MKTILAATCLFALSNGIAAQAAGSGPFSLADIDAMVREEALDRGVPGVGVAIVAGGQILVCAGHGVADLGNGEPVTAATAFNIASVSKPFTALLVLDLADHGRLDLDGKVRALLPWLPESLDDITVRHLLTHTSGIVRDVRRDNADDPGIDEYRQRIVAAERSFISGTRWEYSNTGYAVLGLLAEAASQRPFAAALQERLFAPARMEQASFRAPVAGSARAQPHQVVGDRAIPVPYVSGGFGSGGMAMSAADFAAFAMALQQGKLLPAARLAHAFTPARLASGEEASCSVLTDRDRYGLGWFLSTFAGKRLVTHGGAIQGFSANLYHFPDDCLTVAVLANCKSRGDGAAPVDPLCRRIAAYCLENGRAAAAAADVEQTARRSGLADAADRIAAAVLAGDARTLELVGMKADASRVVWRLHGERPLHHGDVVTERATWYERCRDGDRVTVHVGRCLNLWRCVDGAWTLLESQPLPAHAAPVTEVAAAAAVRATVADYVEGIYAADVERVARSAHPSLAKRGYWSKRGKSEYTGEAMTHAQLLETAKTYNADRRPMGNAPRDIKVFDVLDQTASARLVAAWGVDYFHLARIDGRWQIVNVLWQSLPVAR